MSYHELFSRLRKLDNDFFHFEMFVCDAELENCFNQKVHLVRCSFLFETCQEDSLECRIKDGSTVWYVYNLRTTYLAP